MAQFHSIKIQDIYKETKDCSVVTFDIPDDLKTNFKYNQGQYLTLKAIIDDQEEIGRAHV